MTISSRGINIERPVIILGMTRSGTSIVSSIFREHGLWCGTVQRGRLSGYPTGQHENLRVKKELIQRYGRVEDIGEPVEYDSTWINFATEMLYIDGYKGGPWFVKHSAFYGRVWEDFNPYYILVYREIDTIFNSMQRKAQREFSHKETIFWMNIIQLHISEMINIQREFKGAAITSELLIKGEYRQLKRAFLYCNQTLDYDKVKKIIQPDIWGVTV